MNLLVDKKSILDYNLNLFNSYGIFKTYSIEHKKSLETDFSENNRVKIISNWGNGECTSSRIYYWELFNYSIKECLDMSIVW